MISTQAAPTLQVPRGEEDEANDLFPLPSAATSPPKFNDEAANVAAPQTVQPPERKESYPQGEQGTDTPQPPLHYPPRGHQVQPGSRPITPTYYRPTSTWVGLAGSSFRRMFFDPESRGNGRFRRLFPYFVVSTIVEVILTIVLLSAFKIGW